MRRIKTWQLVWRICNNRLKHGQRRYEFLWRRTLIDLLLLRLLRMVRWESSFIFLFAIAHTWFTTGLTSEEFSYPRGDEGRYTSSTDGLRVCAFEGPFETWVVSSFPMTPHVAVIKKISVCRGCSESKSSVFACVGKCIKSTEITDDSGCIRTFKILLQSPKFHHWVYRSCTSSLTVTRSPSAFSPVNILSMLGTIRCRHAGL